VPTQAELLLPIRRHAIEAQTETLGDHAHGNSRNDMIAVMDVVSIQHPV
jgi:hypothetical protein